MKGLLVGFVCLMPFLSYGADVCFVSFGSLLVGNSDVYSTCTDSSDNKRIRVVMNSQPAKPEVIKKHLMASILIIKDIIEKGYEYKNESLYIRK